MRWPIGLLMLAGCRQVFGIDTPKAEPIDAPDVVVDAQDSDAQHLDAGCADDDHDGICNELDDWPCGVKPTAPPLTFELANATSSARARLTAISVAGEDTLAVVAAASVFEIRAHVTFTNTSSLGAYQIEVGYQPDGVHLAGCMFNGTPNLNLMVDVDETFTAPATAGTYSVLADFVRNNQSCTPNSVWIQPPNTSIAKICVY